MQSHCNKYGYNGIGYINAWKAGTPNPPDPDTAAPTLSNITISAVGPTGYTVSVVSTDDVAVDRVQFPTWTSNGGQDDMIQDWETNPLASGTKNGDTYTYRVSVADHNWEYGTYTTCICTYDTSGNWISRNISVDLSAPDYTMFAAEYGDDFYACIQNSDTNTVLTHDLTGFGNGDYDSVFHSYAQSNMQYWHFTRNDDNSWQISPASDESLALHVVAGSEESGASVILHTANKSASQRWLICEVDGYWTLRPACADDCYLDVPDGSKEDGVSAWIWEYNSASPQKFIINKAETCKNTREELGSDFYAYIENIGTGTVLTRDPDGFGNGDYDAIFTGYAKEDTQIWHFTLNDNGSYQISPKSNEDLALHMYTASGTSGTSVLLHEAKGYAAQQWYISKYDGAYILRPDVSSNCYLDVPDGSSEYGVSARIWTFNGSLAEKYNIVKVDDSIDMAAEGTYDGRTYRVYNENMTWEEAQAFCESMGGNLVSITSQEEQDFVADLIAESGTMNMYWIGANTENGTYVWSDGEPWDYSNWDINEPNYTEKNGAVEQYGQIYNMANPRVSTSQRFKWNDAVENNQFEDEETFFGLHHIGFVYECGICKGNHTWDDGTVTEKASCTENGTRFYACTVCGATKEETIPAMGHDYSETVTDPTCTEQGYTTLTCTRCGDSKLKTTTIDITDRFNWTDGLGILATTGEEQANSNWMASDYVDISDAPIMEILTANTVWADTNIGLAFYDADKNYISGVAHTDGTGVYGVLTRVLEVPENAVYLRSTWYSVNHPNYDSAWGGFSCKASITKVAALGHSFSSWAEAATREEMRVCSRCDHYETRSMTSIVASVGEVEYLSLNAALKAAAKTSGTVTLLANHSIDDLLVQSGVTLDLNGYTLTADFVVGFNGSNIVDNSEANTGFLKAPQNNVSLAASNSQIPVWNCSDGYRFFAINKISTQLKTNSDGSKTMGHLTYFEAGALEYLAEGKKDSGVSVVVRLNWSADTYDGSQDFVYTDATVQTVVNSYNSTTGKYGQVYTASFAEVWLNSAENMTAKVVIISDTGVAYSSNALSVGG